MKKCLLITAFVVTSLFTANAQQTITHSTVNNSVTAGGTLGCQSGANVYSRSFVLSNFGVTEPLNITGIEFGIQDYLDAAPITITLSTTSQAYPNGYPTALTQLATETVTFTESGQGLNIIKLVPITATVPAGSELVVEISGEFFLGGNTGGQTAPSYLLAADCGATAPTNVATLGADFANVAFLINVKAEGTAGVNNVLASTFSVYPNPATNVVNVGGTDALVNNVSIADLNGRTVKTAKFNGVANAEVNVADLSAGVYMMTVASDKGTVNKKIVKN